MSTRDDGARCEGIVCEYLVNHGYKIVVRNYYPGGGLHGEIDIICEDEKYIVFAEVKARHDVPAFRERYGSPARAVGSKKRANIIAAANSYLRHNPTEKQPRLDIVEVLVSEHSDGIRSFKINHIRNAFTATEGRGCI